MRLLVAIVIIVYLVGVGVVLAPAVTGKSGDSTAADTSASVIDALPSALAWPVTVYRRYAGTPAKSD